MVFLSKLILRRHQNFYAFLGISQNAVTPHDLKMAYFNQSKRLHPDNQLTGNHQEFLLLKNIFEIMWSNSLRYDYDILLKSMQRNGQITKDLEGQLKSFKDRYTNQTFLTMKRTLDFSKSPIGHMTNAQAPDHLTENVDKWSEWKILLTSNIFSYVFIILFFTSMYYHYKYIKLKYSSHSPYQVKNRDQKYEN